MRPLATYIEYLLMTRHYAFVPGIGGFMMQEDDARLLRTGELIPPHRLLKFNRFMDHNDGMLTNVVMRAEGLSFDEAESAIRVAVASMLNQVQHEGRFQLGRLGFLFCNQDCQIAFIASDQMGRDPRCFGLSGLKMRSWQEIEAERQAERQTEEPSRQIAPATPKIEIGYRRQDVVVLPTKWLRRAAIVLLVLTFFFANLIPVSDKQDTDFANIINTQSLSKHFNTLESQSWDETWEQTPDSVLFASIDAQLAETVAVEEVAESQEVLEISEGQLVSEVLRDSSGEQSSEQTVQEVQEAPVVAVTKPQKYYLIIVCSCTTQEDAEYQMHRLEKLGYNGLGILPRDGRYRIFINTFDVKTDAETYLNALRENKTFADAWLLAVRPESLSLIIKNKDNDQLPMELSHLNKSAERDQG
ncbi:MAG: SPOR domain-containing protein [Bacteroidales bacterium]|nr:SPOR domain-containing protein [Bacteroidales bacterium]